MEQVQPMNERLIKPKKRNSWGKVLLTGIGFYLVGLIALVLTGNPNLFPTVVLIGSFLIPVAYVAFFYDRRHLSTISLPTIALAFVYGGLLGVLRLRFLNPC